jgi:hypothetical protein
VTLLEVLVAVMVLTIGLFAILAVVCAGTGVAVQAVEENEMARLAPGILERAEAALRRADGTIQPPSPEPGPQAVSFLSDLPLGYEFSCSYRRLPAWQPTPRPSGYDETLDRLYHVVIEIRHVASGGEVLHRSRFVTLLGDR